MPRTVRSEYIKTAGLKGFRKSEVEILVRNPNGQERQLLLGEISHIKRDRRRSKRRDYVTLVSLSQQPRSDITYNLATNRFSITFHSGFHNAYVKLDEEREAAMTAVLYLLLHRSKRLNLQKIGASYNNLPMLAKYYVQRFRSNTRKARAAWFRSAKARRRHRP